MQKRALISVSDKTDIEQFAKALHTLGWEIVSTGGTKKLLIEAGIPVVNIENVTGNPECFDGRMKTISFQVESALLYDRNNPQHVEEAEKLNIQPIDLVCCNLYPFKETIKKESVTLKEAIEQIDIGGPTMIRSAAKNFQSVIVVTDASDYQTVIEELNKNNNTVSEKIRGMLAAKAFEMTADYDGAIDQYLHQKLLDEYKVRLKFSKGKKLRYGENSHQDANIYMDTRVTEPNIPSAKQICGKELSFNNYVDANSALEAIKAIKEGCVVCIVKHNNPCGYATGKDVHSALAAAWSGDPVSAFGSVIAVNQHFDLAAAEYLKGKFVEIIIAPSFDQDAIDFLQAKNKDLRLLEIGDIYRGKRRRRTFKHLIGGLLEQDRDLVSFEKWDTVTHQTMPESIKGLAQFSYTSVQFIKSNAVVISDEYEPGFFRTLAIGAGQPNRINALRNLAIPKALENLQSEGMSPQEAKIHLQSCVLSSDAFFPFRDTVDCAGENNIQYIIQPGGSVRDQESIDACNEHNVCMIFTGTRHFNH